MVTSGGDSSLNRKRSLQTLTKWAKLHSHVHKAARQQAKEDSMSVSVQDQLQVLQTFIHPVHVRAVCNSQTQQHNATIVALHKSSHTEVSVWLQNSKQTHLRHMTFSVKADIQKMVFMDNLKLFAAYCKDMTLRMYSDYQYGFQEVTVNCCRQTMLCMVYSSETNELFGGGVGCVLRWEVATLSGALKELLPCDINFTPNELIHGMSVCAPYQTLIIRTHFNVYIWNYLLQVQQHKFQICQDPNLTSVVFHPSEDLMITAEERGIIQVSSWANVFSLMHELPGHDDAITEMLIHPTEPLLISSSLDGTIRLWRLDIFEQQQKIEVGEPVLGMMFMDTDQIVYWSASTLKMFRLNLFYHLVKGIRADILDVFSSSSSQHSNRLVVTASDGSVRILCPVSGVEITIVYPLPSLQLPSQTVYERTENQLYVLVNGEVLVYGCHTNPAHSLFKLHPLTVEEQILCIAYVVMDNKDQGRKKSFIFTGLADGQIRLLYAKVELMSESVVAHTGPVCLLESACHSKAAPPTLVSYGQDLHIHVWHIVFVNHPVFRDLITLKLMYSMAVRVEILHIHMMDNIICFSKVKNIGKVHMYELNEGDLHHNDTDDHTDIINGIACCLKLGLFATAADDGLIKIWSKQNVLLRDLVFDVSLRGVCFANSRGDILTGVQCLICSVPVRNYLPQSLLDEMHPETEEDYPETALPFETDLALWVKLDKVKVYPVDLVERRYLQLTEDQERGEEQKRDIQRRQEQAIEQEYLLKQQELEYEMRKQLASHTVPETFSPTNKTVPKTKTPSQHSLATEAVKMPKEDALAKMSVTATVEKAMKYIAVADEQATSDTNVTVRGLPTAPVGPVEVTNVTTSTVDLHWHPPDTTGGSSIVYVIDVRRNFLKFHCVGCVKIPKVQLTDLLYTQTYTVQVFAHNKLGNSLPLTSATIYPLKKKRKGTMTASEVKEALEHSKAAELSERQLQDKQRLSQLLEEQKAQQANRRKRIIAPDGHIPNSVVRGQIGYTLPPDPIMNMALEYMAFMAEMQGAADLWKHIKRRNMISWKDKLTSRGFHSTAVYDDESESLDDITSPEQTQKIRHGYTITPELELRIAASSSVHPPITVPDGVSDRSRSRTPVSQMEVESQNSVLRSASLSPETKLEVDKAMAVVLPDILQDLLEELWFPFSYIPPMSELIEMFMELLESANADTVHAQICKYLVQIYGHFGYTEKTLKTVVDHLVEQLANQQAQVRCNCILTLQNLGLKKTEIVSKIVPMLSSTNYSRRRAATLSLRELTGMSNNDHLSGLMQHITMLKDMEKKKPIRRRGRRTSDSNKLPKALSPSLDDPGHVTHVTRAGTTEEGEGIEEEEECEVQVWKRSVDQVVVMPQGKEEGKRIDSPREEKGDSPREEKRDSPREEKRDSPREEKMDSPRKEKRDSPREEKRDSPREEKRDSPREEKRDSPREEKIDSPREEKIDSPREKKIDSPRQKRDSPREEEREEEKEREEQVEIVRKSPVLDSDLLKKYISSGESTHGRVQLWKTHPSPSKHEQYAQVEKTAHEPPRKISILHKRSSRDHVHTRRQNIIGKSRRKSHIHDIAHKEIRVDHDALVVVAHQQEADLPLTLPSRSSRQESKDVIEAIQEEVEADSEEPPCPSKEQKEAAKTVVEPAKPAARVTRLTYTKQSRIKVSTSKHASSMSVKEMELDQTSPGDTHRMSVSPTTSSSSTDNQEDHSGIPSRKEERQLPRTAMVSKKNKKIHSRRHTAPEISFNIPESHPLNAPKQVQKPPKDKKDSSMQFRRLQPSRVECSAPPRRAKDAPNKMNAKAFSVDSPGKRKTQKWSQQLEAQPEVSGTVEEMHADETSNTDGTQHAKSPMKGKVHVRTANRVTPEVKPMAALIEDEEPACHYKPEFDDYDERYVDDDHWMDEDLSPQLHYLPSTQDNASDSDNPYVSPEHPTVIQSLGHVSYLDTPSCLPLVKHKEGLSPFKQVTPSTPVAPPYTERQKIPTPPGEIRGLPEKVSETDGQELTEDDHINVSPHMWPPQRLERRHTVVSAKKAQRRTVGQLYHPHIVSVEEGREMETALMTDNLADELAPTRSYRYTGSSGEPNEEDIDQTFSDNKLSHAQSQGVLEHYRDLAAITAVNISQMKVVIRKLEMQEVSEKRDAKMDEKEGLPAFHTIDYMKNFAPLGPAEPGMRLLKSITVSTKSGDSEDTSSEAGSRKWKMSVDTPDHDSGETKYGILNMGWTTHVPMATVDAQRRDDQLSHILPPTEARVSRHPERHTDSYEGTRKKMTLPELVKEKKPDREKARPLFEWDDTPLPLLYASCKDKHKCDYYRLLKKQMHHHISDKGRLQLPKLHGKDRAPEEKPDWTRQSVFGLHYI